MALLNYTAQYSNISAYLNSITGSTDWLKIFISPDASGSGHFITHGIDFGSTYAGGRRGLVPANSGVLTKTFLRGDGWSALWTATDETASAVGDTIAQQQAAKEAYLQSTIVSAYDIKQWIQQSFAINDSMRFKGKINISGTGDITTVTETGTTNGFPTACEVGDTYKISGQTIDSSSQIAGEVVSSGDLVICIKDGSGSINTAEYWTVVQDNVEHLITYSLNGVGYNLYAQTGSNITLYAPITSGTANQVLISQGSNQSPIWANQNTLTVKEAGKVTYALYKGSGLSMKNQGVEISSYDGSASVTIALLPATSVNIGGVIIDNGTNSEKYNQASNTTHTPYPTISVDGNGQIYLTKANIVNALGYDPISALPIFTDSADGIVPMSSTANKQTNNVDNIVTNTTFLLGADAKWYKLPLSAFQSDKRVVKLAGTEIIGANSANALNITVAGHLNVIAEQSSGNYTGKLTFESTWRDIQVHLVSGTSIGANPSSIGDDDPLVFDNSESVFTLGEQVTVGSGANATQKTVVKSYITWYNMDTQEYEII